ncbi:hypothetical protein [Pseudomonas putida]|uniref:hypothetical protein n=1 Tax=Pseudomonas putida TaxID=303 RepID=UPI000750B602|nr:hypothetical protein [Pseudomonas putida]
MQSADYVPGVSGWKIHDHIRLELNEGNSRVHAEVKMITIAGPGQTNDQAAQELSQFLKSYTSEEASAVTCLSSRITAEISARAHADMALASRIDSVQSFTNPAELHVKPEEAVEPLRMGKVVFHGETARQIRAAQTALREAGVGQLEVVTRASEPGDPFFVIDGQPFDNKATVESAAIDPCTYSLKVTMGDDGRFYIAGVGIGVSTVASELNLGPSLEKDVRRLLREELQPGGILYRH